jgi:hypothetical protein
MSPLFRQIFSRKCSPDPRMDARPRVNRPSCPQNGWRVVAILSLLCAGCLPLATVAPAAVTSTPLPSETLTPTATTVWFPPTATFTPFPTSPPASPTPDQKPGIAEQILADAFSTESPWSESATSLGNVMIGDNALTITISHPRTYLYSIRSVPLLTDFYAEITANPVFCQGLDEYGMLLRYASATDFYRFSLSCDGQVRLDRVAGGKASSPQPWLLSGSVPLGGPSLSRLEVWAVGDEMRFFVNDQYQFTVRDPLLSRGNLGVFARAAESDNVTVNFSNLAVFQVNP